MIPEKESWKLLRSEAGPDLPLFKVRFDYQKNLRNNKVLRAIVLESMDSVNVVALTSENRILMVQQYRFGTGEETLELPGGLVDAEENDLLAAQRELKEETGYTQANGWQYLGAVPSNPVYMDSKIHHWLVRDVKRTQQPQLDEGENIALLEVSIPNMKKMVKEGKIDHPHTLSALARVFQLWEPLID